MQTRSQTANRGAFELFPQLPIEIRRMIWHLTIRPRVLPAKPIAELAVCHEARQFLLEIYKPCLKSRPGHDLLVPYSYSLYANFATDVFMISSYEDDEIWEQNWTDVFTKEGMEHLKHFAVECGMWADMDPDEGMARAEDGEDRRLKIMRFSGLETLSLIIERDLESPYDILRAEDGYEDVLMDDCMEKGYDERVLIESKSFDWPADEVLGEASAILEDWEISEGWKAPEVQLARIVKPGPYKYVALAEDRLG
jgi:hypothetical protein